MTASDQQRQDLIMLALSRYEATKDPKDPILVGAINTLVALIILESLEELGFKKITNGDDDAQHDSL